MTTKWFEYQPVKGTKEVENEKCDECVGYGQVDLQTGQQCCPCNGTGIKPQLGDKQ